jgi:hypothetical protein
VQLITARIHSRNKIAIGCVQAASRRRATANQQMLDKSREALNNSSMNPQSTKWMKCDFIHFFIFNGLQPSKMVAHPCATETLNKSEFPETLEQLQLNTQWAVSNAAITRHHSH